MINYLPYFSENETVAFGNPFDELCLYQNEFDGRELKIFPFFFRLLIISCFCIKALIEKKYER